MRRGVVGLLITAYIALWAVGIQAQQSEGSFRNPNLKTLEQVYQESRPASVRIETFPPGTGSGFFISADGLVMTAFHVIDGAQRLYVRTATDELYPARVVGYDAPRDLALVRISPRSPLPFLNIELERSLNPGDAVLNIGNSRDEFIAARPGRVTRLDRTINSLFPRGLLSSNMPLAPGDSGGPILNAEGKVVGVAVAIGLENGRFQSYGAPLVGLSEVLSRMNAGQRRDWPFLGIEAPEPVTPDLAAELRLEAGGLLITRLMPGGAAEKAGLRPLRLTQLGQVTRVLQSDIILEIDGKSVNELEDLRTIVRSKEVGDVITLKLRRDGKIELLDVVLMPDPRVQAQQSP